MISEEGRDNGLTLMFTIQRGNRGPQLVDRQNALAGHRATLSAVDHEIAD